MESLWPVIASIASALLLPIAAALGILFTKRIQLAAANASIANLKLKGDTADQIKLVCNTAVSAAEQLYKAKKITDRKAYAMNMAIKILTGRKIAIETDILSAYIEAEVLCLSDDDSNSTTTTTVSPAESNSSTTTTTTNTATDVNTNTTTNTNAGGDINANIIPPVGLG